MIRGAARLCAWSIGLWLAVLVVPGVSVRPSGFVVAVLILSVGMTALSPLILRLPHGYASLVMGSSALIMTFVSLGLASVLTHGLCFRQGASWLATVMVCWLCTTIGAVLLPDVYINSGTRST